MTSERASAYGRVMEMLADLGPAKLFGTEQARIRDAADTLLFAIDIRRDDAARAALGDVEDLCRALVESGRWEQVTALRLADDLADCGPARLALA